MLCKVQVNEQRRQEARNKNNNNKSPTEVDGKCNKLHKTLDPSLLSHPTILTARSICDM